VDQPTGEPLFPVVLRISTVTREVDLPAQWNPKASSVVAWIERSVGPAARVVRVDALPVSATAKHLVEVALGDGSTRRLVLRRYHDAKRLAHDPWYAPAHEALALQLLSDTAVPAPRLYAADLEAAVCDVPALLESWVPGSQAWQPDDLNGYLARAAEVLVAIHAVSVPSDSELPQYAPYYEPERSVSPPFSTRPGLWERVADVLDVPRPAHRETFIHRDYHPGNVLWDGMQITGVVDWATAACGPPGIDLARMRLNLASHFGRDIADRFVVAYVTAGGDPSARNPFWDLLDAADLLPDITSPMRLGSGDLAQFEDYVESVLAES
jgi:aminoglycoside phosphotransferase (APT) family kinase protein